MKAIKVFLLGFGFGWLYKWIFDQIYTYSDSVPMVVAPAEFDTAPVQLNEPVARLARPTTKTEILEVLKGIGPASVRRLNQAGVHTFDDLANLTPEQLRGILGNVLKRAAITEMEVIAEARRFAEQKTNES